jgi:hypothetical protein
MMTTGTSGSGSEGKGVKTSRLPCSGRSYASAHRGTAESEHVLSTVDSLSMNLSMNRCYRVTHMPTVTATAPAVPASDSPPQRIRYLRMKSGLVLVGVGLGVVF